jgi:hypothetical protein
MDRSLFEFIPKDINYCKIFIDDFIDDDIVKECHFFVSDMILDAREYVLKCGLPLETNAKIVISVV